MKFLNVVRDCLSLCALLAALAPSVKADSIFIYNLALTTTGEFGEQFSSLEEQSDFLDDLILRTNEISIRDLGIKFVLIPNNDALLHTDPATDPFNDGVDKFQLKEEGNAFLESTVDPSLFQLGHTIAFDLSGGVAFHASPCDVSDKGLGVTSIRFSTIEGANVIAESSALLFIHELGHQLGADHTFNGLLRQCEFERSPTKAVEPGAGSTIMSYAGSCGNDNFAQQVDPYFHSVSIDEIREFRSSVDSSCIVEQDNPTVAPTVKAAENRIIPKNTPLILQSEVTVDSLSGGQALINWEQTDPGTGALLAAGDDGQGPLFRSRRPSTETSRYLPNIADLLNGVSRLEEQLPSTSRTINMQVNVRDSLGGVAADQQVFTVDSQAGPFLVTSPTQGQVAASSVDVTWDSAGTASETFGAEEVDIFLSLHGGASQDYITPLLLRTPNDGSEVVSLPAFSNDQAQIIVKASDNDFFNISPGEFTLNGTGRELCPVSDVVNHFSEDWETGSLSGWTASTTLGDTNWAIDVRNADTGSYHIAMENPVTQGFPRTSDNLIDARLTIDSVIEIKENVILEIRHAETRIDGYSAGLIELSTDGGEHWRSIDDGNVAIIEGAYDATVSVGTSGARTAELSAISGAPSFGRQRFGGPPPQTTADYQYTRYDMSAFTGATVLLRFRFLSTGFGDTAFQGDSYGWDVDAIRLYSCVSPPRLFVPELTYSSFSEGFDVAWSDNGTSIGSWSLSVGTEVGASDLFSGSAEFTEDRLINVQGVLPSPIELAYFELTYVDLVDGQTQNVEWEAVVSPTLTLPNNQWVQFGAPVLAQQQTLAELFAGYLDPLEYGINWQLFEYVQGAAPSGYRAPDVNETLVAGRGYWLIQITGAPVVVPVEGVLPQAVDSATQDCPAGKRCIVDDFPIADVASTYWIMVSNPYRIPVSIDDLFIGLDVNGQRELVTIDTQGSQFLHTAGIFSYNPSSVSYDLQSSGALLAPMRAGWVGVNIPDTSTSLSRIFAGFQFD